MASEEVKKRAYARGRAAAKRGQTEMANPYHCATEAHARKYREWLRGHREAKQQALQKSE